MPFSKRFNKVKLDQIKRWTAAQRSLWPQLKTAATKLKDALVEYEVDVSRRGIDLIPDGCTPFVCRSGGIIVRFFEEPAGEIVIYEWESE